MPLALERFTARLLPRLIVATFLLSFVPLFEDALYWYRGRTMVLCHCSSDIDHINWARYLDVVDPRDNRYRSKNGCISFASQVCPVLLILFDLGIHLCQGHRQSASCWRVTQYHCFHSRCLPVDPGVYTVAGGISWMLDPSPLHLRVFSSTKG